MKKHLIKDVVENSIADQLEIKSGDYLVSIDGNEIKDVFDYHLFSESSNLTVEIEDSEGEVWEIDIEKDEDEDLGFIFDNSLLDEYKSCTNKCIFCFIDQMPPGMRETLYFKDDDSRLSFIQGNYVTLTNMTDDDVDRIIRYNLSPINISIHTMDKELRCKMLNNRFAGDKLEYIKKLNENNITMNAQIVLCKGYNDKEKLDETLEKMMPFIPNMKSCSVVPAGSIVAVNVVVLYPVFVPIIVDAGDTVTPVGVFITFTVICFVIGFPSASFAELVTVIVAVPGFNAVIVA